MYEIILNSTILTITLISAGHFFSKIILQNKIQLEITYYGILGIVFLSILSFILNLLAPLNEMISNFIFIFIILNFLLLNLRINFKLLILLRRLLF